MLGNAEKNIGKQKMLQRHGQLLFELHLLR